MHTFVTFDVERYSCLRRARGIAIGEPLRLFAETGSTNDEALQAARDGAPHGSVFVAEQQTRGRGRIGHRWTSRPGESLTFSVLLRPAWAAPRPTGLTLALGLAVRDAAAALTSAAVRVKWPNDVLANEQKLAGVLVETQVRGGRIAAIIVGIGINVGTTSFPPELENTATSFARLGGPVPSREQLLIDVLSAVEARARQLQTSGLPSIIEAVRSHDALQGKRIRVDGNEGIARGIADDGALLVEAQPNEPPTRIIAGTVERL